MPKITELWAYIIADTGPDDEGVTSFWKPGMQLHMPMVGADLARMESLKPYARQIAKGAGKPVRLVKFSNLEEIEEILP